MRRGAVLALILSGCSGGGDGDKADGAVPRSDAAESDGATPDGAGPDASSCSTLLTGAPPRGAPDVPFEDRTWGSLEEIGVGRYPEAAIDAEGNAMTTWDETGVEGCVARRKPLDGAWEPDVALEVEIPGETDNDYCAGSDGGAGLAMDAAGAAILLFLHATYSPSNNRIAMRAQYDPASGWAAGEPSGPSGTSPLYLAVAMNEAGSGLMAWAMNGQVWAVRYDPDTGWEDAVQVDSSAEATCCVRVVLDAAGDGLAIWKRVFGDLRGARLAGGTWSSPEPVDDGMSPSSRQWDIGMNEAGAAVLAWRACADQSTCAMRARRFDPCAGWLPSEVIGDAGQGYDGRMVDVALDPDGNGMAVWATGPWVEPLEMLPRVDAARFHDGVWMAPETLGVGEAGHRALDPNVVLDPYGNGLVGWRFQWGDADQGYGWHSELMARTYTPAAGFGPVEPLDAADDYSSRLELAMNATGIGIAVWNISTSARARVFR